VTHRSSKGLTLTANYTYAKSIDDASSASGDKNILTPIGGQVQGQVVYGGTRAADRSVSTYDQRHVIHSSIRYDLPFGRGQSFGNHLAKPLDYAIGGWTIAGLPRIVSGFPYMVYLPDSNQLGDQTHSARPNIPRAYRWSTRFTITIARPRHVPAIPESAAFVRPHWVH